MKTFFLIFLFCFTFLEAHDLTVKESVLIDENSTYILQDILQKEAKFQTIKKYSIGTIKNTAWIKLQIINTTNKKITKRLYNKRTRMDFIDVYILKNQQLVTNYKLGVSVEHHLRDNHFRASYFDIELLPQESIDIYIKQKTFTSMDLQWHLLNINDFNYYFELQDMIYFTVLGMLIVITVASFMLYFLLKLNYYLIYAVFSIVSATYQFSVAGYFYQYEFSLYFNTVSLYVSSAFGVILVSLFPISFFGLKKGEYKIIIMLLKFFIALRVLTLIAYIFYPLNADMLYMAKYGSLVSMSMMILLLILSIRTFMDKRVGSGFYLVANLVMTVGSVYFGLGLQGIVETSFFVFYPLTIGAVGQDIILAFALVYATYKIKKDNEINKELVDEYTKLSFLGQTVINIYHQWKSPVNNIYNSINHIEVAKEFQDKELDKIIDENLVQIKQNTEYLKETAFNYLAHYKDSSNPAEKINLYDEINSVVNLLKLESEKINLSIEIDSHKNLELFLRKNHLTNLLMILLENAMNIFKLRKITNPTIQIIVVQEANKIILKVQDNAGGIENKNVNTIFGKDYSASSSTGLGLFLAKEFLVPNLGGEIFVENVQGGAVFTLILSNYN
ncbi:MAG: sensor histidine kinase [Campylobacterales bacterium]|nr:sensor histidine kinase [Campylobacterales bacterium]